MRKLLSVCITIILLLASFASAEALTDLTSMDTVELTNLRDKIDQELKSRVTENDSPFIFAIENDVFSMKISSIEVVDRKTVNEYYDQYDPGTGTSDECPNLVLLFTIENKSNVTIDDFIQIKEASINGWMISSYTGIRDIAPGKKGKGFIDAKLVDCEAETLADINSFEFTVIVNNSDWKTMAQETVVLTHAGDSWIAN